MIDGQQRLTTFQIFLAAFRDLSCEFDDEEIANELRTHTLNVGKKASPEEEYKVWPTRADQRAFTICIKAGSRQALEKEFPPTYLRKKLLPRHSLVEAYIYFNEVLSEFLSGTGGYQGERAEALFSALQSSLNLVSIELESKDDPQVIFETLNARGEPLLSSDLLRNYIFQRAKREGQSIDDLYARYWEHFDTRLAVEGDPSALFWKTEERQGRLLRSRLDLFIQHLLSVQTGKEVNVSRLFHDYKRWIETAVRYPDVIRELQTLNRYAEVFSRFFTEEHISPLGKFLTRFQRLLDTSTVFPLLLYLCADSNLRKAELDEIFAMLESYVVRRIVCGFSEKNYNQLFLRLMRTMREESQPSSERFRELLLALDGDLQWPGDSRFRDEWLSRPIYRSSRSQTRIEAMLRAIEQAQCNQLGEQIEILETLTIEHIMPQAWEEHWPLADCEDMGQARSLRDDLIHTFGNLTLLTHKLNASLSNGPYANKRPEISRQSRLSLNTWFQTQATWSEDDIRKRGMALFEAAVKQWPHPGGNLDSGWRRKKSDLAPIVHGEDKWGFRLGSRLSRLMEILEEGGRTKAEIRSQFLLEYPDGAEKSTFDVFFSDVVRPFGVASASRDLRIIQNADGVLHLDLERSERAKVAIAKGLLKEVRSLDSGHFPKKSTAALSELLQRYSLS